MDQLVTLYSREMMMKEFKNIEKEMNSKDLCFFFVERLNCFSLMNKIELQNQLREWKELTKKQKIYVIAENNFDLKIKGVLYYILVIQSDEIKTYSKAGLFLFDNNSLGVDGWFYCFKRKENRDMVYEYIYKFQMVRYEKGSSGECCVCLNEDCDTKTKCCNQYLCTLCIKLMIKKNCPLCRFEY